MTRPAAEFQWVNERVAFWQAFDPAVKTDLSCCALLTSSGLVFVDPIPLAASAAAELTAAAKPVAIVLTNGNHARGAAEFRTRHSIPICAHADARATLGLAIDRELAEAEAVVPGLVTTTLPGAGPGEIALHFESRLVAIGDALINVDSHGFALLPDKYCENPKMMRASLGKLLRIDFEIMTFAHGLPLISGARSRLESLLA
jgi:Metallo-beta-lactamase superfamily